MPVWSFTTDPFERELIFRSSYIKEAKCQQKYFDSSLVNPYENVIPFFCFSVNHRRKALCHLPYLTLSFMHFKTTSRGELSGRSETVVSALRWLWFVYCITTESAAENWFCQALFVLCILHDLFRCWGCKSYTNLLTISLIRIIVINLKILCQSQSQVTATLPT